MPTISPHNRPWSPSRRDRIIYQWVKFNGETQADVAQRLEIHQSTVSRIIERYELWLAHGGPAQEGAPNHEERLRAQRWLTYERNEWIISTALRLAGDMQRALDTSKSTLVRPLSQMDKEAEVRTENKVLDRSGIAARFLRLAHKVNMDQLKLVEGDELIPLEPLTHTDIADFDAAATAHEHATQEEKFSDTSHDPVTSDSLSPWERAGVRVSDSDPLSPWERVAEERGRVRVYDSQDPPSPSASDSLSSCESTGVRVSNEPDSHSPAPSDPLHNLHERPYDTTPRNYFVDYPYVSHSTPKKTPAPAYSRATHPPAPLLSDEPVAGPQPNCGVR